MIMSANVASIGLGLLLSIALARGLGPEYKGRIDLFNNAVGLAEIFFGLSLGSGAVYVVARGKCNVRRLAKLLAYIAVLQMLAAVGVVYLLDEFGVLPLFMPDEYLHVACAALAVNLFSYLLLGYWRSCMAGLQRYTLSTLADFLFRAAIVVGSLCGLLFLLCDVEKATVAVIVGSTIGQAVVTGTVVSIGWRQLPESNHPINFGTLCQQAVPSFLGNATQFLNYRLGIFVINGFFQDNSQVAFYANAATVTQLLWLPAMAIHQAMIPKIANEHESLLQAQAGARVVRFSLVMTATMGVALAIVAPWLIAWVFGDRFTPSVEPVRWLLPGVCLFGASMGAGAYLLAVGKAQFTFWSAFAGLVVSVVLLGWLVPVMGIAGAAAAASASYATTAAFSVFFFCKRSSLSLWQTICPQREDVRIIVAKLIDEIKRFQAWRSRASHKHKN